MARGRLEDFLAAGSPGPAPSPDTHRDHASEESVSFPSGATMSAMSARYDLICPTGLRRLAERYALGAEKHGDLNWCKAGDDPEFQRARLNHLIKHVVAYLLEGDSAGDDNLAAIAWGAFALMHYEEHCKHHETKLP
jgi:hypothetical protein